MRLLLIFSVIFLIGCAGSYYPKKIGNKIETVEFKFVLFNTSCANWLPNEKGVPQTGTIALDHFCFIEAADPYYKVPEKFRLTGNRFRLTGAFYEDKGISRDYNYGEDRPDRARVFRYTEWEILKPYKIYSGEDSTDAPAFRTIE
jgi:hypothetical protein